MSVHTTSRSAPGAAAPGGTPRHGLVDALRGLALFGILAVNLEFIASPPFEGWDGWGHPVDVAARWLTVTLFQLKSYLIFALLFGYGTSVMAARAPRAVWRRRHLRRMAVLLVLGVLHAVFFFVGDILTTYALLGATLVLVIAWSSRSLLRLAGWLAGLGVLVVAGVAALLAGAGGVEDAGQAARTAVYLEGTFLEVAAQRIQDGLVASPAAILLQWPMVAAAFLVGIVIGRGDLLSHPERHRRTARRTAAVCLPVGFGLSGVAAALSLSGDPLGGGIGPAAGLVIEVLAGPICIAGVIAGGMLLVTRRAGRAVEGLLTPAGRTSLSFYLGESVIASLLFTGYGLGLAGRTGPAEALGLAVLVYGVLTVAVVLWLRVFRQGPAEWLLRTATYMRRQPLRR